MDTEQMIERARRIADDGVYPTPGVMEWEWAEALLAEHDARVAAERERDEWHQAYESADDRAKVAVMRADAAEARVATLEAALSEAQQMLREDGANAAGEVKAVIDAALGDQEAPKPSYYRVPREGEIGPQPVWDQEAPTEPTAVDVEPLRRIIERARGVQVPHPWTDADYAVQALIAEATALCDTLAAPQVAPEPERCPTCGSDNPMVYITGTPQNPDRERCNNPWHRPAPLVEGEQR